MSIKLYLAGPIEVWKEKFKDDYSEILNNEIDLFEPGRITPELSHDLIPIEIAEKCREAIDCSDAILAYISPYSPSDKAGDIPGADSSWELGYAAAEGKSIIVLIDDLEVLDFWAKMWMVSLEVDAILTHNKEVKDKVGGIEHLKEAEILYCESAEDFEEEIINFLGSREKSEVEE